jgi:protoporphyrin/coproporphyrin ferrochelatase
MTEKARIAVILAAHGEAETTGIRENYRVNMQTLGHASLVMPIPAALQRFISVTSSVKKRIRSFSNSQASPHNRITREQAMALGSCLADGYGEGALTFDVHAAFSASDPSQESIIDRTRTHDAQVIISMSPIDSTLSCGLLCSYLASTRTPAELGNVRVLSRFWDDGELYPLFLGHLLENRAHPDAGKGDERVLVLMFHGTIVSDTKGKEPEFRTGLEGTMTFARRLCRMIEEHPANPYVRVMPAFLNHDVGGNWTRPSFEEVCREIGREGYRAVDLFGCGYFADGNETIHRASELIQLTGLRTVQSIPCLNSSPSLTAYLASKVTRAAYQIMGFR